MDYSGGSMLTFEDIAMLLLHSVLFIFGAMGNVFILLVNFIHWLKGNRDLNSCDLILTSLGLSNVLHVCIYFFCNLCRIAWREVYLIVSKPVLLTVFCLRSCNFLFTTIFCVYCCVTIVNSSTPFFMRLKVKFPGAVPWLLLASVLVSLATCLPVASDLLVKANGGAFYNFSTSAASNVSGEGHMNSWLNESQSSSRFLINAFVSILCLATLTFSAATILTFLCIHMRRVEQNMGGFTNSHLGVYLGAIKTISSLFVLYVLVFLSHWLLLLRPSLHETPGIEVCVLMNSIFPALSSVIFILGYSKLKKAFTRDHVSLQVLMRTKGLAQLLNLTRLLQKVRVLKPLSSS
ncbi:taste receptor type 2 member 9-like [Lissotriton helveticus]